MPWYVRPYFCNGFRLRLRCGCRRKTNELKDYKENGKGFVIVDFDGPKPLVKRVKVDISRTFIERSLDYNELESGIAGLKETIVGFDKKPILDLKINNVDFIFS